MKFLKLVLAWLAANMVTAVTGSVIQTQFNLAAIAAVGADIPFGVRLQTTLHDLAGFAPMFAGITAAGFLVAFVAAGLLARRWPARRTLLYASAGAAAMATAILLINAQLPMTPIGATRQLAGLLALAAAGGLGGWAFAALAPGRARHGMA
jgi:MFS family permease